MSQPDFNQHFEKEKAKLNPEQRAAVEAIEGPVMVLAGPGTGKTQVLAFRIAEILQKTDSSPRNILALTFTESGVAAMRERLVSLIGVAAYGVGIYTFHSFANRVINDAGAEFYKTHSLDPIDDITRLKLILRLIDEVNNPLLRPVRAPYWYAKPIIKAIRDLKNEGVTPDRLRSLCQEAIATLQADPKSTLKSGKNKGELKQSIKDLIERYERSQALADLYERYETSIEELGLYDYEDMILFVINSFHEQPNLKAKYQEQFHYILVDEYQDTNNAQNMLIRLLSDYFDTPNIFVVGDDKQSIYRFQGASMSNLLNFRQWYPESQLISLKQNYRSGQIILDNAQALIAHNKEQLTHELPVLQTSLQAQTPTGDIFFTYYATNDKELLGVVSQIKRMLQSGVRASDIAVIYRENSEAFELADLLNRQGIAFHLEAGSDVLKDSDVRHLINLLELAYNPNNEFALFRFLHAPYSQVTTTDLITLGRWRKEQRTSWTALITGEQPTTATQLENWNAIKAVQAKVAAWHRYQLNHNIGDTVEHIFIDSGLLALIMEESDHLDRLHRIRCFFEEIKHVMTSVQFATLPDLFERLEIRKTYNLTLVCLPIIERSDDAIRLMTAHKSKGLEFEYVFIPNMCDGLWSNSHKNDAITLPAGIVAHHEVSDEQSADEERRLFYVALTRAKQTVYLSFRELDKSNKKQIPCQYVTELSKVTLLAPETKGQLPLSEFFSPVATHFVTETSQAYLRDIVSQHAMTPTGLNTYLTCPLEYLYKEIYCIPGVREPFQSYGTAIHKSLELWGSWSKTGGADFGLKSILSIFYETLVKEGLTEDEVARYGKLGEDILTSYYESHCLSWVPPLATEYSFTPHSVKLDGTIPITGKIDKIEPIPGSKFVRVIDFKTGRVKSRNDIEGRTTSSDGDYKRQLVFYTVLAECDPFFPYAIGEASIAFIDDHKKFTSETFTIDRAEKESLKELIRAIRKEVMQLHFDHTPHKKQFGISESLCDLLRSDSKSSMLRESYGQIHLPTPLPSDETSTPSNS